MKWNEFETDRIQESTELDNEDAFTFEENVETSSASEPDFFSWCLENKEKVQEYFKDADRHRTNDLDLSTRIKNALYLNGMFNLSDFVLLDEDSLENSLYLDSESIDEIKRLCRYYLRRNKEAIIEYAAKDMEQEDENLTPEPIDESKIPEPSSESETPSVKRSFARGAELEYFKALDISVFDLELSNRSANALKRAGVNTFYDLLQYDEESLHHIRNLGSKSYNEIRGKISSVLNEHSYYIRHFGEGNGIEVLTDFDEKRGPFDRRSQYRDKALEYIQKKNIPIQALNLSVRSINGLTKADIKTVYDLLLCDDLGKIDSLGKKSLGEIQDGLNQILNKYECNALAYAKGDSSVLFTEEELAKCVLACFDNLGFQSLSYRRIKEKLPEEVDDDSAKRTIGRLLNSGKLEYVDFRIYRKYPSFFDYIDSFAFKDERSERCVRLKLKDYTLEEIGQQESITRERVRQIIQKERNKINDKNLEENGASCFDEDYYAYVYSTYNCDKEFLSEYLGVNEKTISYIRGFYKKGEKNIEDLLQDDNVDLPMKARVQNYIDRKKLLLDGKKINSRISDIENYVLEHYCQEELTFDEFSEMYNKVLKKNGIQNSALLYSQDVARTRMNRLGDSRLCLWKQGKKLRYYDIDAKDYEELLSLLNLSSYKNTEVSTRKFMNDYPEVMEKYEIRDEYELHNLLKKIINPEELNDVDWNRQPIIRFGEVDRVKMVYEIISVLSPISVKELAYYLESEYGFEQGAIPYGALSPYLHNGVYSVEYKKITEEKADQLKESLTEDFYYIDDVVAKYLQLFPGSDPEEINGYTLKSMGFSVNSKTVLRNWTSLDAYFKYLLTQNDIVNYGHISRRFERVSGSYYKCLSELKQNFDVIEFEPGKIIQIGRLEKVGVTKQDLYQYCDSIYNHIENNSYFTIYSLRESGFKSKLDELGFDDSFYGEILLNDKRFNYSKMFNSIVLRKGTSEVTRKSFIRNELSHYDSIDLDDFVEMIKDNYGITKLDRDIVKAAIQDSEFYYDRIMDKVYINEDKYYDEFDN